MGVGILVRHLLAIAVLPFTVTVIIPAWLLRPDQPVLLLRSSPQEQALQLAGVTVVAIGLLLFVSSLSRFADEGKGTLAPWDPPRHLVVRGPYRYVRNPMISGVVFILFGEAMVLLSRPHLMWALTFLGINFIYIPLLEEPQLRSRFGASYEEYCRHVRRLLPRMRPWDPGALAGPANRS